MLLLLWDDMLDVGLFDWMGYGLIWYGFDICAIASDGWIEYLVIVLTVEIKGLGPFVIYQWAKLGGFVRKRVCRWLGRKGRGCGIAD